MLFFIRKSALQKLYDLGYEHGRKAGAREQQKAQISKDKGIVINGHGIFANLKRKGK
ncbi:hypothetical protein M670_00123 [Schinkia azotoformans MEV2011]|uniref:Uncharacterized protein n=1 Tax=Schinkia azotoformans MEV2011 TaxID=1348973 RepID=A0A072NTE9_SCHAZ|nr:hypothetical protein [Schinkia azotoformans]KEF40108.1 hypothetical protein M670_00123 [Schinkia azotoformans MEV2011]